jgi:hypothetical protein
MRLLHQIAQFRMPLLADDATDGRLRDHIRSCISCQAEASRYRSLRRLVSSFGAEIHEPPFDLVPGVMAALDRPYLDAKRRSKAGAAAGAAVAVAGAVVVARLARRRAA